MRQKAIWTLYQSVVIIPFFFLFVKNISFFLYVTAKVKFRFYLKKTFFLISVLFIHAEFDR